jgi:hypothetical protein
MAVRGSWAITCCRRLRRRSARTGPMGTERRGRCWSRTAGAVAAVDGEVGGVAGEPRLADRERQGGLGR